MSSQDGIVAAQTGRIQGRSDARGDRPALSFDRPAVTRYHLPPTANKETGLFAVTGTDDAVVFLKKYCCAL
jgi:hypothetical protein